MANPTRTSRSLPRAIAIAVLALLAAAPAALAHPNNGSGATVFERPDVTSVRCGTGDETSCPRGYVLRLSGEGLGATRAVTFLGGKGRRDDRTAKPTEKSPHRVLVAVPRSARSGRLRVITATAAAAIGPRLRVLPAPPPAPAALPVALPVAPVAGVFPVRGKHDFGTHVNEFGGGRGHQGHDVFADCGTPLVAALGGEVTMAKFQSRAGNYVVIKADDGTSQAYMHLLAPTPLKKGDRVVAGQPIGEVGETGRASGCHLHFELWTAPGWYEGGHPVDPLPFLRSLPGA